MRRWTGYRCQTAAGLAYRLTTWPRTKTCLEPQPAHQLDFFNH